MKYDTTTHAGGNYKFCQLEKASVNRKIGGPYNDQDLRINHTDMMITHTIFCRSAAAWVNVFVILKNGSTGTEVIKYDDQTFSGFAAGTIFFIPLFILHSISKLFSQ